MVCLAAASVPAKNTSAPRSRVAATLYALVLSSMTTTIGDPIWAPTNANACAKFPEEVRTTPAVRCSTERCCITLKAALTLNEPVTWRHSAFRNRRSSSMSSTRGATGTIGVRRTTDGSEARARSISSSVVSVKAVVTSAETQTPRSDRFPGSACLFLRRLRLESRGVVVADLEAQISYSSTQE